MSELKNRFTKYFAPLLDALRTVDPEPMRPAAVRAWIRANIEVPAEDLTRFIRRGQESGKQTIFENDVYWAKFYLAKAGLVAAQRRGFWCLTPEGRGRHLSPEEAEVICVEIRNADRQLSAANEDESVAPGTGEDGANYWLVGPGKHQLDDQMPRFIRDGIWENGYDESYSSKVRRMKPGDRLAVKKSTVRERNLPFDVGGKPVSVMRIIATGTVVENLNDGRTVKVSWDPEFVPRDWYFYMFVHPVALLDAEIESAQRLIDFIFRGEPQDYQWFLAQPYWAERYGDNPTDSRDLGAEEEQTVEFESAPLYSAPDIVADGCFLSSDELEEILKRWRSKKNLILQGPPGTGKTWLAKRLGFALIGSNDRETNRSRLRVVQFHPSLSYEDFVRGWRPSADGKLTLADGILMRAITDAASEPDRPFVLVIEEINRGNPAQIFGEMLTLLENTKRHPSEAMELAYKKASDERVFIPENLYVIGTMNIADRSLAIVDLALRRRFAFVDLEPRLWA